MELIAGTGRVGLRTAAAVVAGNAWAGRDGRVSLGGWRTGRQMRDAGY